MRKAILRAMLTITLSAVLMGLVLTLVALYCIGDLSNALCPVVLAAIAGCVPAVILAVRAARRLTAPVEALDPAYPPKAAPYPELAPLLGHIARQNDQLSQQARHIQQLTDEFRLVTADLRESLVLLDGQGNIQIINPAAAKLFQIDTSAIGKDYTAAFLRQDVKKGVAAALSRKHSEVRIERNGLEYLLDISPLESDRAIIGVVLLAFDVTDQAFAQRNRREFTANVSHELKTPLQSIIGSAELLENGLVQQADVPRFICHIRREASRLVALIEDIIRLSQLDENAQMPQEEVELQALANEVIASLQPAADAKDVRLTVSGKTAILTGVRRLLYEILYNLCDNAIKYNVPGGSVDISVTEATGEIVLAVKDTGIGIPPEHHARVFERFYRVDKSHSKQSSGTGLGLSIVKHAALYHRARISLESTPGQGTEVSVTFPI